MPNEFNTRIIGEFRANQGRVGRPFEGAPMVLLTTKGARTQRSHTTPLVPLLDNGEIYVFASMGGAPKHPAWYHNLVADSTVTVEYGSETFTARAEVITGAMRDELYAKQAGLMPAFGEYQSKTTRTIPVIALRRKN